MSRFIRVYFPLCSIQIYNESLKEKITLSVQYLIRGCEFSIEGKKTTKSKGLFFIQASCVMVTV